jgi:hypothetical protein
MAEKSLSHTIFGNFCFCLVYGFAVVNVRDDAEIANVGSIRVRYRQDFP